MESPLPFDDRPVSPMQPPRRDGVAPPFPWSSMIWGVVTIAALLIVLLGLPLIVERVGHAWHAGPERAAAEAAREALDTVDVKKLGDGFGLIAKAIGPSVVHINVRQRAANGRGDEVYELFGGRPQREAIGQGSGVIVDAAGYVVTNYHVVRNASEIQVRLSTGKVVSAQAIGADALTDVAVLKIEADGLVAAPWGDSDALEIGAFVWAVGSPFGLDHSITFGILSAKAREGITASAFQSFLQTDAAVNPGNSGGPLVNVKGEIVGINTAIVGPSYQGVSFALPSNTAKQVYERLRQSGAIDRGWLGVEMEEVTPELAQQLNLEDASGVLVRRVVRDAPADLAGIQPTDVIREWNGQPTNTPMELSRLVAQTPIGSKAKVTIIRNRAKKVLEVQVAKRPDVLNR